MNEISHVNFPKLNFLWWEKSHEKFLMRIFKFEISHVTFSINEIFYNVKFHT